MSKLLNRLRNRQAHLPPLPSDPRPISPPPPPPPDTLQAEHEEAATIDYVADHVERLRQDSLEGPPATFLRPD